MLVPCLVLGLIILPSLNWLSWTLRLRGALRFRQGSDGSRRVRFRLPIFFCLEKKWSADRWISALRESDGSIVSSPADLCRSLSSFYFDLFTASDTDPCAQSALLGNLSSVLPSDQAALCGGHLSATEVSSALLGMARRKAPGLDGLPVEFYIKFWDVLGLDLVSVLNSCLDSGSLALSQCRGIISLSFKKGDRLDPRN